MVDVAVSDVSYYNIYHGHEMAALLDEKLGSTAAQDFGAGGKAYTYEAGMFTFTQTVQLVMGDSKNAKRETTFWQGMKVDAFTLLTKFRYGNRPNVAAHYVRSKLRGVASEYIRVGVDYYKEIQLKDRNGIYRRELKRWKKDEIKEDNGKLAIQDVIRYDSFVMEPNNLSYDKEPDGAYNLYHPFSHEVAREPGDWPWTEELLRNVFGDQFELGLKYLQALYLHPKQALPILVLASVERATGKTTFLNWLAQLFGNNYTVLNPSDLTKDFNGMYALKNVIAVEETKDERSDTVNKLKNLSTSKYLAVNQKFIDNYSVPFFGKFIITSNEPKRFLRVDENEIRMWVRILKGPKGRPNTNIEADLKAEIPAFLKHLTDMPAIDFTKSRMVFTADEIKTEALIDVKQESRSELHKDILGHVDEYFVSHPEAKELHLTVGDIRSLFFRGNNRYGVHYIGEVLRGEMGLEPRIMDYHQLMFEPITNSYMLAGDLKKGKIYTFKQKSKVESLW